MAGITRRTLLRGTAAIGGLAAIRAPAVFGLESTSRATTASRLDDLGKMMHGELVAGWMAICHSGPPAEGERVVAPLKEFGTPVMDFIGPTSYSALQTMFDAGMAVTTRNYWRSSFMKELGDDVLDSLADHAADMPRPGTLLLIEHMGGSISRAGEHETAFANRGAEYNVSVLSSWLDPEADAANIAWTRQFGDELNSLSTGGAYVNYMANSEDPSAVRAAYEANFERLVEVKRKYDPDDFFNPGEILKT